MAALPKFSFSGWSSQSLAPKINPATAKTPAQIALENTRQQLADLVKAGKGESPLAKALQAGIASAGEPFTGTGTGAVAGPTTTGVTNAPGTLVGQTNAANTNLPAWLQSEVDKLNAAQALRTQMAGQVTGTPAPAFDPNIGIAAVTNARANYNRQVFGMNQQANLSNMLDQRNQMQSPNAFGFNNPLAIPGQLALDQRIQDFQRFNLPAASGWVGGGRPGTVWANGLLNGTGWA